MAGLLAFRGEGKASADVAFWNASADVAFWKTSADVAFLEVGEGRGKPRGEMRGERGVERGAVRSDACERGPRVKRPPPLHALGDTGTRATWWGRRARTQDGFSRGSLHRANSAVCTR